MSPSGVRRPPQSLLIAPDKFKGTLSALEVARALARGVEAGGRLADLCPVSDGGDGTAEVLAAAMDADLHRVRVSDPLGRSVQAQFALAGPRAVVEMAAASGLSLVGESERDAVAASTAGSGELIGAALEAGARTIYLGVGGSATTDGGAGAIKAIQDRGGLGDAKLIVLCDVRTPFEDAARVFGPQKGADPEAVRRLTARLHALAGRWPRDPRGQPMTGAAGGLAGGLWAVLGAELVAGASFILDALDFDQRMRASHAVITGEGRLDDQSLVGKAVSEVATRARQGGVPCHAVVGQNRLGPFETRILDLQTITEAGTLEALEAAGRRIAETA
jgi:glycerate kinase